MSLTSTRLASEEADSFHIADLQQSPTFSGNVEEIDDDQGGDYSTRMEELLSDEDEDDAEADEYEGGFVYDGVDADQVTGDNYRDQLRDVLGPDDSYYESEEQEVARSLLEESNSVKANELLYDIPVSLSTPRGVDTYSIVICTACRYPAGCRHSNARYPNYVFCST